jgi:plasmid maintenance system antidote protein VapI
MGRPANPVRYLLRTEVVAEHIDRRRLRHGDVAQRLSISQGYWSQLLHRGRPLTAEMRQRIVASRIFRGLPECQLWERVERGAR